MSEFNAIYLRSSELMPKATVLIRRSIGRFAPAQQFIGRNHVLVVIGEIAIVSYYFNLKNPDKSVRLIGEDLAVLAEIVSKYNHCKLLFTGDGNSKHRLLGGD